MWGRGCEMVDSVTMLCGPKHKLQNSARTGQRRERDGPSLQSCTRVLYIDVSQRAS
jgi:hypothetical protein